MTSLRPFHPCDLFTFNTINLDSLTETYDPSFYLTYLARWPHLQMTAIGPHSDRPVAYLLGKTEASPPYVPVSSPNRLPHHAHVTAVTVAPAHRRLGLARRLCQGLEAAGDADRAWFVDLFVRRGNETAVAMYRSWGYSVFRTVREYYSEGGGGGRGEDAFDMRKPLKRDKRRKHMRERGELVVVSPDEVW